MEKSQVNNNDDPIINSDTWNDSDLDISLNINIKSKIFI